MWVIFWRLDGTIEAICLSLAEDDSLHGHSTAFRRWRKGVGSDRMSACVLEWCEVARQRHVRGAWAADVYTPCEIVLSDIQKIVPTYLDHF